MKIWLLTSEFPPDFGGGICTYCLETAQMFASFGHDVTVITQNPNIQNPTFKIQNSFRVLYFNPNKYFTSSFLGYEANLSYAFARVVEELAKKEGSPDIIESQEYMGIAYYLLQFKWLQYPIFKDLKVLIMLHAPSFLYLEYNKVPIYQLPYFWIGEMERFCIRSADLLTSPSQYLLNEIKTRVKTDDLEIHVIKNPYNTVDSEQWAVDSNHSVNFNYLIGKILFFGKLIPQKGCLELISYFKQLWNEGFEYPLTMIGGGAHLYHPEGIDMIDFITKIYKDEINSGKLKLLGAVKPNKLNEYISDAHVIIIPSMVDNLPYTVPEVMSRGKVVLASIQGGQSEIIENEIDGFLFDHKDGSSFKSQLKKILSLPEESIKTIGKRAHDKIQKEFAYQTIYNKKIKLIQSLENKNTTSKRFPFIRPQANNNNNKAPLELSGEKELLSVVIPYYNMGRFVKEAVLSIVNSTYKKLEIILVNDGSTGDENTGVLTELSKEYNVRVINKMNEGLPKARNEGARQAKGDYLAFLDPDDTVEPGYYEKAINVLTQYDNIYFAGCWAKYFGNSHGYWPSFNPEPPYLLFHNMINSSALVYKKTAFLSAGLNDSSMIFGMEDYESVISMVENGYFGVALPEPLWNYRIRSNSIRRRFTKNKQVYLYWLITDKHSGFYSIFAPQITNLLNANGPGFNYDNPSIYHNITGNMLINNKLQSMIVTKIKSNKVLRKIAIKIKYWL